MMLFKHDIQGFYWASPWFLLLGLLLPLWFWIYRNQQARLWREAVRFSYAGIAEHLKHNPSRWKRLWNPLSQGLLFLTLTLALARPTLIMRVPSSTVDMMLVLDISLSMMAEDIRPSRIEAAKAAAREFIESLPNDVNIGLTFFAGSAYVISPPVADHARILAYLNSLKKKDLQLRTEIGTAIESTLQALKLRQTGPNPPQRVMVLLSDGDSREGYPWPEAATHAKNQNVAIYTVGIGSEEGTTIVYQDQVLPVLFSEDTLKQIAETAGGHYFRVFREKDFKSIYDQVRERAIRYTRQNKDMAFLFAGLGLLIWMISNGVKLLWIRRITE